MKRHQLILLTVLLTSILMTGTCHAQASGDNALKRTIHLPQAQGSIYQLLQIITQKTGYHLMYDSNLIDNERQQSIADGTRTISSAIHEIIAPQELQLTVQDNYILITPSEKQESRIQGTLLDNETGQPIPYGTIYLKGSSWGTVSNQDGQFLIHIPDSMQSTQMIFSHIGYQKREIPIDSLMDRQAVVLLSPNIVSLHEVVVRMRNPISLLNGMLELREKNYPTSPSLLTTFYREGIHYRKKLLDLTEGIFQIYKPGVKSLYLSEQVKQLKNNRISFRTEEDSLLAKISGGIGSCLTLDIMQHLPTFLQPDLSYYECDYFFSDMTWTDDRCTYIIRFQPKESATENFYEGEIYLDAENLALMQVSFRLHPDFLRKTPLVKQQGKYLKIIPQTAEYTLSYRQWGNRYYVNHVRGDLHFKVKKRRSWFSRSPLLHTWFEMATCHIDTVQAEPFPRRERIRPRSVFMDTPQDYDPVFWRNFNIIPREKQLKESIKQLQEQLNKAKQMHP